MPCRLASVIVLALAVAACGSSPPSGTPASSALAAAPSETARPTLAPSPSPEWQDAAIRQPDAVSGFASQPPGYFCDPCHNLEEDNLFGVGSVTGGFIAVGAVTPPARAIALWSADGRTWAPLGGFGSDDGSAAVAVAQSASTIVLVGHDPAGATAWAGSTDGAWTQAPPQTSLHVAYAAGGMNAVIPFDGGFVAAGYRDDPAAAKASAAVWRSADGLHWTLDAVGDVFAGGRITGLAAVGETLVAVGTGGELIRGPAAAWRWTKETGWRRADVPAGGGAMRAVVPVAGGLVAVGIGPFDTGAMAWTSPDGRAWTAVQDQPAFHFYEEPVRLQALALAPDGTLIAAGWRSDQGAGSSVVIASPDGAAWTSLPWQASFSGGQVDGLAAAGSTLVAAGRVGYPDTNTAAVWVRDWP